MSPWPFAIPRNATIIGPGIQSQQDFGVGEWELLSYGSDVMIFAVGRMVQSGDAGRPSS